MSQPLGKGTWKVEDMLFLFKDYLEVGVITCTSTGQNLIIRTASFKGVWEVHVRGHDQDSARFNNAETDIGGQIDSVL
jgi:hypothetical protein